MVFSEKPQPSLLISAIHPSPPPHPPPPSPICHYLPLFATIHNCSWLFALFAIRYSDFPDTHNAELFVKLFYIQSNEIKNNKYYEEKDRLKNGKDITKQKEYSWLNAIKTKIAFAKRRPNFRSKSSTAANIMFSICFFVTSSSFQTYLSTALILEGAKTLWFQKN